MDLYPEIDLEKLNTECNQLIRYGFCDVHSLWTKYAVVKYQPGFGVVEKRRQTAGTTQFPEDAYVSGIRTYAKMLSLSRRQIASGEYRDLIVNLGARAATKLSEVFWSETGAVNGPCGFGDAVQKHAALTLDDSMDGISVEVTFLAGHQFPTVDCAWDEQSENVIVRGYYDFSVDVLADAVR